jgi:archaemetzincin
VTRHGVLDLPAQAYYRPRRRYRADKLLDTLATIAPDAPPTTKVLGLTEVDISTTNEDIRDWGIFGLGSLDGRSAVMSSFRLRRRARGPEHLAFRIATTALHEVGHTFGLPHCEEDRCAMLDAEGGIENTDTSTGHFGPGCQAAFARSVERPAP